MHSGYEECRADSIALYLVNFDLPFQIFFPDREEEWDNIYYTVWLNTLTTAIKSLKHFFNPNQKDWGQPHGLGNYVILQMLR